MYALAQRVAQLEALADEVAAEWGASPARVPGLPGWAPIFAQACATQAEQTGAFVRAWLAVKAQLPVFDAIHVDAAGTVLDSAVPVSLFATMSDEEEAQLLWHEVTCAAVVAQLETFHRDA